MFVIDEENFLGWVSVEAYQIVWRKSTRVLL